MYTGRKNAMGNVKRATHKYAMTDFDTRDDIEAADRIVIRTSSSDDKIPDLTGLEHKVVGAILINQGINELPDVLKTMPNLEFINVTDNHLAYLPDWICKFKKLHTLKIVNNKLYSIPQCISELHNLQNLIVPDNRLTYLPESIVLLPKIDTIDISKNKIAEFPFGFESLEKVKVLKVAKNPLKSLYHLSLSQINAMDEIKPDDLPEELTDSVIECNRKNYTGCKVLTEYYRDSIGTMLRDVFDHQRVTHRQYNRLCRELEVNENLYAIFDNFLPRNISDKLLECIL